MVHLDFRLWILDEGIFPGLKTGCNWKS